MKTFVKLAILCLSVASAGCCSIVHGTSQGISVNSVPSGAKVFHNGVPAGTTPAVLELKRNAHHTIRVEKEGFSPYEESLTRSTSGWVWGNIFLGGLIGLAVDAIDGAIYNIEPQRIQATLLPEIGVGSSAAPKDSQNTPLESEQSNLSDSAKRLRMLKQLHEEGVLSDEEYKTKRQDALDAL